jgi:zinc transporter, ZIP family
MSMSVTAAGFAGSLAAGAATGLGTIPIFLLSRSIAERQEALFLSFAAGVMLGASFFSLLIPALGAAQALGFGKAPSTLIAVAGLLSGAGAICLVHQLLPHEHFHLGPDGALATARMRVRRVWLFVAAITLHNLPEGLAVGVSFGSGDFAAGAKVATGIGLQNMPEGLAVAASLAASLGYPRWKAAGIATLTGLVESIAGLAGAATVAAAQILLPWGLAFAAGAMLFVISREIIPETHNTGRGNVITTALLLGLCVMMFLDVVLS